MATGSMPVVDVAGLSGYLYDTNEYVAPPYSMLQTTQRALETLLRIANDQIPDECRQAIKNVKFNTANDGRPLFPCPFKETEAVGALKAVEAGIACSIADLALGKAQRKASVDLQRASAFLFSAYLATVGGYGKCDPKVKLYLKDTDLLEAQSRVYRRLSANLYETKNRGEYFHIHGSLEATTTLRMIGLPPRHRENLEYREAITLIEGHVMRFTAAELEKMNAENRQAGITCYKPEEFKASEHGRSLFREPLWRIEAIETSSPPIPFIQSPWPTSKPQILSGIKVLELCRIISGPSMGKGLAEYGAQVMKVTSPNLSDIPFFQVDVNVGKHTIDLDLRSPGGRATFEKLLQDADVVLDGYRPGAIERLGYGPQHIVDLTRNRGKGIIYIAEDCFGSPGPWSGRPGWQQIADCATGVAWEQGWFMGLNEPVVPPFPMSDYGSGCMGTIAALTALYKRAISGGSYFGKTSMVQYDMFLLELGVYGPEMQEQLRRMHDREFFGLRHHDSVDEVSMRALRTMRRTHPELFAENAHTKETWSDGFKAHVRFVKPVVNIEGTWNGWLRQARPNGYDQPGWDDWEVDKSMLSD